MKSAFLASALCLAASTAAYAQVDLSYQPNLEPGDVIRSVTELKMEQNLVLGGMNVDTSVENFSATLETVGEPTAEGNTPFLTEFEYYIVNLTTPAGDYSFDSGSPESATGAGELERLTDLFTALSKAKWTTVIADGPEVESIEFEGEPFADLEEDLAREAKPEKFRQDYEQLFARYPDEPVSVGDSWTRTETSELGGGQTFKIEKKFTYVGTEEVDGATVDKISVEALSVVYNIGPESPLPLKLEKSDLEVSDSEGMMIYDREQGRITDIEESMRIKGELNFSFEVNGQKTPLPGTIDLKIEGKQSGELKK
ncbi:MAG: hypothetical protein DWQ34_10985 [Planctomycetota bacterium]|nr:MAG: hypothetical protein DWQ34_10985 [Planctomycetota bacterium]REK25417.1 MAG: hypothetical protein DWQ41_12130 [Planctomycetota bacterium]REK38015.1 MAG: hypothetical protein DWQ45_05045 [Planctomycetota bacterium]